MKSGNRYRTEYVPGLVLIEKNHYSETGLIMKWTFENFEADLSDLNPRIRDKALEIANRLIEEGGYTEEEAIEEAIKEAEEWFLNSQG